MNTVAPDNCHNNMNMTKPVKQTKHMKMGVITNYALILLWMHQYGQNQGFTKKQLVANALGHINNKYISWPWSDAAFSMEFSAFHTNNVLSYDKYTRLWYAGEKLNDYLKYHFGPYTHIYFKGESHYDAAVMYNEFATQQNAEAYEEYQLIKQVGREYFFQD